MPRTYALYINGFNNKTEMYQVLKIETFLSWLNTYVISAESFTFTLTKNWTRYTVIQKKSIFIAVNIQ